MQGLAWSRAVAIAILADGTIASGGMSVGGASRKGNCICGAGANVRTRSLDGKNGARELAVVISIAAFVQSACAYARESRFLIERGRAGSSVHRKGEMPLRPPL